MSGTAWGLLALFLMVLGLIAWPLGRALAAERLRPGRGLDRARDRRTLGIFQHG